nr:RNA-directed DNA polymerase, eukaryota [Tanacetum cinerariifolium]
MGSILVNGNPTPEFKFHKGLKQGDPLSPFLFIFVMKSLHLSFNNILNAGLFKGIRIDVFLSLSHLFYADDAIFIAMYGDRGSLDNPDLILRNSIWISIIREFHNLSRKCANLLKLVKKKVGNGVYTRFWEDPWLFDLLLMHVYPRLYALECVKHVTVAAKLSDSSLIDSFRRPPRGGVEEEQLLGLIDNVDSVILSNSNDRWGWSFESSGEFSVKTARSHIDDFFLPSIDDPTRWIKIVPIKINIWKVRLDRLPKRINLSLHGIDLPSIICPICCCTGETCSHILFTCNVARQISCKVARWWELDIPEFHSYEDWLAWLTSLRLSKRLKEMLEGVFYVMWCVIWKFRNQVLFSCSQPRLELLYDEIVLLSFTWCSSRCKNKFDWISWLKCPGSLSL